MNQDLKALIDLQEIDLKINELKVSSQEFPQEVQDLEATIAAAESKVEKVRTRISDIAAEKKDLQQKVIEAGHSLERSQDRLNSITTNREYDAVHAEIETHKQIVERFHNRTTDLDSDSGGLEEALALAEEELAKVKSENDPVIAELKAKIATIDSRVAVQVAERDKIIPGVSKAFIRTYEHVLKSRKSGKVVSKVTPHDKTCSICYKVLEPQLINELRRGSKLNVCQSCGSLLIWVEDELPADNPDNQ